jgi:hypothetical protein
MIRLNILADGGTYRPVQKHSWDETGIITDMAAEISLLVSEFMSTIDDLSQYSYLATL